VFVRNGTVWTEQAKLQGGEADDHFGFSVSLDGDTALIGAPEDGDPFTAEFGAVYVFVRSGTAWSQQAKLLASDGEGGDKFGYSVSLSGNRALIGAHEDDDMAYGAGSAYVFVRGGAAWSEETKLTAADGASSDYFGKAVSISGDTAMVGALRDDNETGSVYVFMRAGTAWSAQPKLRGSGLTPHDLFGCSVSLSGDSALIGARNTDGPGGYGQGSAYVFTRIGTTWSEQALLTASDGGQYDMFGYAVSVSGDKALVGAVYGGPPTGAAYVFEGTGGVWSQVGKLMGSDVGHSRRFGESVSISGDTALVGTSGMTVSNALGEAYVFENHSAPEATCTWYCGTGANAPTDGYVITNPAVPGGTFAASVTGCSLDNWRSYLVGYSTPLGFPSAWGEILVNIADPSGELLGMPSGHGYQTTIEFPVPGDPRLIGFVFYTQAMSWPSICLHCAYTCTVGA